MRRTRKDHYKFSHYADKTKAINIYPVMARGGFRL